MPNAAAISGGVLLPVEPSRPGAKTGSAIGSPACQLDTKGRSKPKP